MVAIRKAAIITGGAKGIGRAIALRLATDDINIVVADMDLVNAKKVLKEIYQMNQRGIAVKVDVSKPVQVKKMVKAAIDTFKRVDILVNNASICYGTDIPDLEEKEWDRVIDVNLKGTFLCCQTVYSIMKEQKQGRIINIASLAGQTAALLAGAHYAASKAGQIALTKLLAKKMASFGVTVNSVSPACIRTDMLFSNFTEEQLNRISVPVGRFGEPWEVAEVVAFLVSEKAGFINGAVYNVNGGLFMD